MQLGRKQRAKFVYNSLLRSINKTLSRNSSHSKLIVNLSVMRSVSAFINVDTKPEVFEKIPLSIVSCSKFRILGHNK
jgi:hypothetical protein